MRYHCRNKYPLGPYYFPVYEPIVTEAATARIVAENQPDFIDPAEHAAALYKRYSDQCNEQPAQSSAKPQVFVQQAAAAFFNSVADAACEQVVTAAAARAEAEIDVRSLLEDIVADAKITAASNIFTRQLYPWFFKEKFNHHCQWHGQDDCQE